MTEDANPRPRRQEQEPATEDIDEVAPGVIRTDMTDAVWVAEPFQRSNQEQTPFNRDGTTDDVASTVSFLASTGGSYINGQTIALDGGWSTTKYLTKEALLSERVPMA